MRHVVFLVILLFFTLMIPGCTQPVETTAIQTFPSPPAGMVSPEVTSPTPGVLIPNTTPIPAEPRVITSIMAVTVNPRVTATRGPVLPHITNLKYAPRGKYSECSMRTLLPDIVDDPEYGLNMSLESRLTGFSEGDYAKMTREAKERSSAINPCYQTSLPPYWTWYEFSATLSQISGRPQTYNITLYAMYESQRIPVVISTETLNPRQDYPYKVSIPIKSDQVEKISLMELGFDPGQDEGDVG